MDSIDSIKNSRLVLYTLIPLVSLPLKMRIKVCCPTYGSFMSLNAKAAKGSFSTGLRCMVFYSLYGSWAITAPRSLGEGR